MADNKTTFILRQFVETLLILILIALRKKCLYSEFFWSVFSRVRNEYEEIRSISPYTVRMRENAD